MAAERPRFLFVGNHPALDFINTQMIVKGKVTDLFETLDDLLSWLKQAKLVTTAESDSILTSLRDKEGSTLLQRAKLLRTTLRSLVERVVARKTVSDSAIETLNQYLSQRPGYSTLVRTKGKVEQRFQPAVGLKDGLLAMLAEAASDLICRQNLAWIKKCANDACILYFLDTTKNHGRNWCSMELCGNRMKVAAFFKRKRTRGR